MSATCGHLAIGPLHCAWLPHHRGTPAESLVRPWLAGRLGTREDALELRRDRFGRPHLPAGHAGFDANWSHSGQYLLMALGEGVQVGADLEFLRPRTSAMLLARRFFTAAEADHLQALPDADGQTAFVRLWCAKEAVLKAHGRGIAFGLDRLEFSADGGHWRLTACDPALGAPQDWQLHAFSPLPGYLATLAWKGRDG